VHAEDKKKTAVNMKYFKEEEAAASRPNRSERVERLKLMGEAD
jgi:hypothetical protein